jgi:His/Glu/Gln/Arg/opine family amino acid ABC transporter permease subunit
MLASQSYNWGLVWTYHDQLLSALVKALEVAVTALALSVVLGVLFALWRMARPALSWPAALYINIFRGMPALVSGIWVYFGWSLVLGINLSVYQAAVIALVLLYSAYLAEIFRAALTAIPRGQREAGSALGLGRRPIFFHVILPQAAKIAIPNVGSMMIGRVKDTSTFVTIGLVEVVYVTESVVSTTYQPCVLYSAAAALYVSVAFVIDFLFRTLERLVGGKPSGRLALLLTARKRRRLEALAASGPPAPGMLVA